MARVVLGVGGGIAAYKACALLRDLTEAGHDVYVVPTRAALQFVGAATWAALSGHPVTDQVWDDAHQVPHVRLGQQADLVVVAPATADLLARAAHGLADDLLGNVLLTARCPVVMAPAMHTEMWDNPATRANVVTLRSRGVLVVEPTVGRLAGPDSGKGRLPEPEQLAELCRAVLARGSAARPLDLAGRTVLVTAGGTREPLDPVRFLGNRSSGRQGYALAATAVARGADVVLVSANVDRPDPAGVTVVHVETAEQMRSEVLAVAPSADAVVMAAAVADFRPAVVAAAKLKKGDGPPPSVDLVRNPDILGELVVGRSPGQVVVGFAAETGDAAGDWLAHARAKQAAKGCDLLVANRVGEGLAFGTPDNAGVILGHDGRETPVPLGPKEALADAVWDAVAAHWG